MPRRAPLAVAAILVALSAAPAARADGTSCLFGGPTPGYHAIRLDLTEGTSFLTLDLPPGRSSRPVSGADNWHLAQGIFVLSADTLALEAYRIASWGMAPRAVVVEREGQTVANQTVVAPEVPYVHAAHRLRSGLPPGSYYVISFGSDGGSAVPNEWWSAGVQVDGTHSCARIGFGEVFDHDQTDFRGGTQVYAPGAGFAEDVSLSFTTQRRIIVGLIDAQSQARPASDVRVDFTLPTSSGSLQQRLVPMISGPGPQSFSASYSGFYPVVTIAGVAIDLP